MNGSYGSGRRWRPLVEPNPRERPGGFLIVYCDSFLRQASVSQAFITCGFMALRNSSTL